MWFHFNTYSSFSPTTALGVGSSQVGADDVIFMYIEFIEISHAEGVLVDSEQRVRKGYRIAVGTLFKRVFVVGFLMRWV